jgi:hypothetical protein
VRTDARLQRADSRQRLHLDAALPLGAHIKVAQRQRADDESDAEAAQHEARVFGREYGVDAGQSRSPEVPELEDDLGNHADAREHQRHGDQRRL